MTAAIELDDVRVQFGDFVAVQGANLTIKPGEFFSFLGPSGCGKTTLLRTISGFTEPTNGKVRIGGKDMTGVGPNKRPTALIFQNLALFPMMSVVDNIGYGLRVRGVPKAAREKKVQELLHQVALPEHGAKRVSELSGGQKQRVAIARALAVEPSVLLLDEPLSALDLKLRQHMRSELRAIQKRVGITFVYITHDQGEALTMSDRIAVMNAGRIEQVGDGRAVYTDPQTSFVASFVGENNAFAGRVSALDGEMAVIDTVCGPLRGLNRAGLAIGSAATLFVRPECLKSAPAIDGSSIAATVQEIAYEGMITHVKARLSDGTMVSACISAGDEQPIPEIGQDVRFGFSTQHAVLLAH
jgi:spermidine/putrescine transport system ATP-binding protein